MTNRITGTNSGIDVDTVVKESLLNEQNKIDKAYQQQKVYEYQQEQLKEIVSDAQDFYDKYLDILSSDSLLKSTNYETASFTSTDSTGAATTAVTAKGYAGADITDYSVTVTQIARKASATLSNDSVAVGNKIGIKIGEKVVSVEIYEKSDGSNEADLEKAAKELNSSLKSAGLNVTAKYSEFAKGIVIESGSTGEGESFELSTDYDISSKSGIFKTYTGQNAKGTITKDKYVYDINSSSNTVTVDNVQFTLNSTTDKVILSGKTDISNLKDSIVNFVNDYNKLIENINTKLWESRDTDYMPLTEDQKDDMSDSEIEAWEKKAKTGLLRNDSDLTRIQSAMKSAMSSMMSGTGLTLESIGIEPVDNYTTKNGMFTIDEDKLTEALQNNAEEVKDLFTRASTTTTVDGKTTTTDKGGVLAQLQSTFKSEFKSSSSSLSKRIGFEGTATENNNTLSNYITKQKTLIEELQDKYDDKETALYNKYSNLEVMLEKLNAQSNSLSSLLGTS